MQELYCSITFLTTLDLSNNVNLEIAIIDNSNLSSMNLNGAVNLVILSIQDNNLSSLDISTNIYIETLYAVNNNLSSLDLRNGNNIDLFINIKQNPNLSCISVDDTTLANTNWTVANSNIDQQHYFSLNCSATGITEIRDENRRLLKITDMLGRETKPKQNTSLFYLYSDGTMKKRIVIE